MKQFYLVAWEGEHLLSETICGNTELVLIHGNSQHEIDSKLKEVVEEIKMKKLRTYSDVCIEVTLVENIIER